MSANTFTGYQTPGKIANSETTKHEIYGPYTEYNHHDEPTGETYYKCQCCGTEALTAEDIEAFPCERGENQRKAGSI